MPCFSGMGSYKLSEMYLVMDNNCGKYFLSLSSPPSHSLDEEWDINEPLWWWMVNDSANNGLSIIFFLFCNPYTEDVQISVSNHSLLSHNYCCLSIHILESPYLNFSSLLSPSLPSFPIPSLCLSHSPCLFSLFPSSFSTTLLRPKLILELRLTLYLNIFIRKIILNL